MTTPCFRSSLAPESSARIDRTAVCQSQALLRFLRDILELDTMTGADVSPCCLDAAHSEGILHRDIKPANIFVEPAPEIFNLFNVADYDLPGNKLGATLNGATGSINGITSADRPNCAGFGSGSFALGIPRAWQLALRVLF